MSTPVQRRGGTAAQHASFVGLPRELTVDTTNWDVKVHDGATPGGHSLLNRSNLWEPIRKEVFANPITSFVEGNLDVYRRLRLSGKTSPASTADPVLRFGNDGAIDTGLNYPSIIQYGRTGGASGSVSVVAFGDSVGNFLRMTPSAVAPEAFRALTFALEIFGWDGTGIVNCRGTGAYLDNAGQPFIVDFSARYIPAIARDTIVFGYAGVTMTGELLLEGLR